MGAEINGIKAISITNFLKINIYRKKIVILTKKVKLKGIKKTKPHPAFTLVTYARVVMLQIELVLNSYQTPA